MAYEKPIYSRSKVDKCARILIDSNSDEQSKEQASDIVSNWRSAHSFPLNVFQKDLRRKCNRVDKNALVVQRTKRTRSIISKLVRQKSMRLTQMQDIGGCRAVLETLEDVMNLRKIYGESKADHEFIECYDYIQMPKESGYRSIHLVYSYKAKQQVDYDGLLLEIQIRTSLQHAWATAVETVGAVLGQSLKSSEGEAKWLEFFQYAATAFAYIEGTPLVKGITAQRYHIKRMLIKYMKELQVEDTLKKYRLALNATGMSEVKNAEYFLLVLRPEAPKLEVFAYPKKLLDQAYKDYRSFEQELPTYSRDTQLSLFPEFADYTGAQAVLVGAKSFKSLKQSYPNYYLDTQAFTDAVQGFVS